MMRIFRSVGCVSSPGVEQVLSCVTNSAVALATLVDPLREYVLLGEVVLGRIQHDLGARQTLSLPGKATLDHPPQNTWPLPFEGLNQVRVRPQRLVQEGNNIEATSRSIIDVAQGRLMVT